MTELPKLVEETIKFYIDYPPVPRDDIVVPIYYSGCGAHIEQEEFDEFCEIIYVQTLLIFS